MIVRQLETETQKPKTFFRLISSWLSAPGLRLTFGLALLTILFMFMAACGSPPAPAPKPQEPTKSQGKIEAFHLTEVQEGDKSWVLKAEKADFLKERHLIRISDIRMEFYGPAKSAVKLTCQEGSVNTDSREVNLQGQVEIEFGEVRIKTALVIYQPNERLLLAPEHLVLEGPNFTINGKGLRLEVRQRRLELSEHHVTSIKMARQAWPL